MRRQVDRLWDEHAVRPGLGVVLVGERPDSATYVRMKKRVASEIGLAAVDVRLSGEARQGEVLSAVKRLEADPTVHAILVQLPLPEHLDEAGVLAAIPPEKDADGFSAVNVGNLCLRGGASPVALPCTPAGCLELLKRYGVPIAGARCVVLGRSNIVGMPVAQMLQNHDATVTICHSRTRDLEDHVRQADILVAAVGSARFVPAAWLKPGCVVVDVGINAVDDAQDKRGYSLVGDVDFEKAREVASMITPVPGGVGPMTIAMLMKNTVNLARTSLGLPPLASRHEAENHARPAANQTLAASSQPE